MSVCSLLACLFVPSRVDIIDATQGHSIVREWTSTSPYVTSVLSLGTVSILSEPVSMLLILLRAFLLSPCMFTIYTYVYSLL